MIQPAMTIQQALTRGYQLLEHNSSSYHIDTQILLCHALDCQRTKLIAWPQQRLNNEQQQQFTRLITKRQQGWPVAYLTGHREFWSLDFSVTPDTLIPRPETELLVETILEHFGPDQHLTLSDLGTGSGAIACAIASERPNWQITATDISTAALSIARKNAGHYGLNNIRFITSDWFSKLPTGYFDIIVSNPPYIASDDRHLQQGDVRFEPVTALSAGSGGMDDIKHLCQHARPYLKPGGLLLFEHGFDQQQPALNCLQENGYKHIIQKKDLSGQARISGGRTVDT